MRGLVNLFFILKLFSSSNIVLANVAQGGEAIRFVSIPFQLFDNRLLVDAFINGKGPFKFIFDTGGNNSMTPELAAKLGLAVKDAGSGSGAGPGHQSVGLTTVGTFDIGSIRLTSQKFWVIDDAKIKKAFNFPALDGVFGYEFLTKYKVLIDFKKGTFSFSDDIREFDLKGFERLPFHLESDKPVIETSINGKDALALLDTGDRTALTITKKFRKHGFVRKAFAKKPEILTGVGTGGPIYAQVSKINSLKIGQSSILRNVAARGILFEGGLNSFAQIDASIGNEVLRQFDLIFDYEKNVLFIRKNASFGQATKFTPVPNPEF